MICTYYRQEELDKLTSVSDKDINELFQEIRQVFGGKHYLRERTIMRKKVLRKPRYTKVYILLYQPFPNDMEVQVINFCQDHDWSINTEVTKSYIITFFIGLLNGREKSAPNT